MYIHGAARRDPKSHWLRAARRTPATPFTRHLCEGGHTYTRSVYLYLCMHVCIYVSIHRSIHRSIHLSIYPASQPLQSLGIFTREATDMRRFYDVCILYTHTEPCAETQSHIGCAQRAAPHPLHSRGTCARVNPYIYDICMI